MAHCHNLVVPHLDSFCAGDLADKVQALNLHLGGLSVCHMTTMVQRDNIYQYVDDIVEPSWQCSAFDEPMVAVKGCVTNHPVAPSTPVIRRNHLRCRGALPILPKAV